MKPKKKGKIMRTGPTSAGIERVPMQAKLFKRQQQLQLAFNSHHDYYAINQQPAYGMFGAPDFVDTLGREFRIAFTIAGSNEPTIMSLLQLRASKEGSHVDDTLDNLVANHVGMVTLLPMRVGSTGRIRFWVRIPKKSVKLPWISTSTLPVSLEYVGDQTLMSPDEEIVQEVVFHTAMRQTDNRMTGYADVTGISEKICEALLKRRVMLVANES